MILIMLPSPVGWLESFFGLSLSVLVCQFALIFKSKINDDI